MRYEIRFAEENMYRAFNELNKADELDIFCKIETRTTSYIPRRTCEPVFFSNMKNESAQAAVSQIRNAYTDEGLDPTLLEYGLSFIETDGELRQKADGKYQELSEEILRIATENPDYLAALRQIGELKAEYEAARKLKFGAKD